MKKTNLRGARDEENKGSTIISLPDADSEPSISLDIIFEVEFIDISQECLGAQLNDCAN